MDVLAFGRLNQEFHLVIRDRCPNLALVRMLRDVSDRIAVIRQTAFVHIPYRGATSVREHRDLIELIRTGAPIDEIEDAARAHKLQTLQSFRDWRQKNAKAGV